MKTSKKFYVSQEPAHIINKSGKKIAVVLDIKTYEHMLECLEDAYLAAKSKEMLLTGEFVNFKKANT